MLHTLIPLLVQAFVGVAPGPAAAAADTSLVVLSAASLVEVLPAQDLAWQRAGHAPLVQVLDATSRLARQLEAGAPGDVFLAADREWMAWAVGEGLVVAETVRTVAANSLVVVVGVDSRVTGGLSALDGAWNERLMLAGDEVPAGRYARAALEAAGRWGALESRVVRGGSVRQVLEWVARGEADAGVVYRTDALGDARVAILAPLASPPGAEVVYMGGATTRGDRARAEEFLAHLASPAGVEAFEGTGFSAPAGGWGAAVRLVPAPPTGVGGRTGEQPGDQRGDQPGARSIPGDATSNGLVGVIRLSVVVAPGGRAGVSAPHGPPTRNLSPPPRLPDRPLRPDHRHLVQHRRLRPHRGLSSATTERA